MTKLRRIATATSSVRLFEVSDQDMAKSLESMQRSKVAKKTQNFDQGPPTGQPIPEQKFHNFQELMVINNIKCHSQVENHFDYAKHKILKLILSDF